MQKLEIYQSLWAMELRRPGVPERSMADNFELIAEAGFDGVSIDPGAADLQSYEAAGPLYEKHGLRCMVNAFPTKLNELRPILEFVCDLQPAIVNVIGGVMPVTLAGAIPVIYRWLEEADQLGLSLLFETHRDGLLNDLYYTLQVLDSVPELRLCADLSHFVVDRELRLPLSETDKGHLRRVLERSDSFQGRVASAEQVQIQLDFPQHQEWVDTFKNWWRDGIRMWRRRNPPDATLAFLCELGPPPYAITDAVQAELSDRFGEALQISQWVQEIWRELAAEEESATRPPAF
jgi:hypothetical protein